MKLPGNKVDCFKFGAKWNKYLLSIVLYCIVFIYTLTMALNASKRGFIAEEYVTWCILKDPLKSPWLMYWIKWEIKNTSLGHLI